MASKIQSGTPQQVKDAAKSAADLAARTHSKTAQDLAVWLADGNVSYADESAARQLVDEMGKRFSRAAQPGADLRIEGRDFVTANSVLTAVRSAIKDQGVARSYLQLYADLAHMLTGTVPKAPNPA
jgi:hypothetical protein